MGNHERKHLNGILSYSQEIVKIQFGERYDAFLNWIKTLDYYHKTEEAIIIHAFFEHDKTLSVQREDVLAGSTSGTRYLEQKYGQNQYWQEFYKGEKPIIYGHHVVGDTPKIINNTYGIDTGACHSGMLTAIELPSFKIHQIRVEQDYWKTERVKWQVPVLKAKPWETMTFDKIQWQIDKLRYIDDTAIQSYLVTKQAWLENLKGRFPSILEQFYAKANVLLQEHGHQKFNIAASQYPYKVSLFKARANKLTLEDVQKQLNTPEKLLRIEQHLKE